VKTFQEFIAEAEAANSIKSLAPFRVMPPLKTKDRKPNPAPQRYLIDPVTGFGPGQFKQAQKKQYPDIAQIAPMKSTVLGPDLQSLPHVDTRGPGEKLKSVMRQKAYMDDTGRRPPKIP
jgi:hypothetical protein